MTAEVERGCGFRKPGGIYLVSDGPSVGCDRLPLPISPCSCCGYAPSQTRSHQWLPGHFLGDHRVQPFLAVGKAMRAWGLEAHNGHAKGQRCGDSDHLLSDPICRANGERRLLMWVGRQHYTPGSFAEEASRIGVSKRIADIPDGLVLGKTWVLLAHPDACYEPVSWSFHWMYGDGEVGTAPGLFQAFVPRRVEVVLHESEASEERVAKESARGVSVVIIPDGAADARISWRPGEPRPEGAGPTQEEQAGIDEEAGHQGPTVESPFRSGTPEPREDASLW